MRLPCGLDFGANRTSEGWYRHHADACAVACHGRDDCHESGGASGGRFICGLGASGPQVVEGWHGVPYGKPVSRLREYIQIMKNIFAREGDLTFEGSVYNLPYTGEGATGLGKPLKSILHCEEDIPIFAATITDNGVAAAAEVADGFFPVWMDPEQYSVFQGPIEKGFAKAGEKDLTQFEIAPLLLS